MNLTQIIEETGKRIRLGKRQTDKLTNVEIKEVLDTALVVLQDGLVREGRIEIQGFAVLEVITSLVKAKGELKSVTGQAHLNPRLRRRWIFRPSQRLRDALKQNKLNELASRDIMGA
jgi:nucleoid DNA-binding protein